ncbi:hypothetical protein HKCCA1065_09920 [Rhodobacterales bacterium HKCCA1065]|nr:hypothetical protein [Rhodobacterales bacterium HKCCA1058]MBF9056907.1 hypothetical protein [Rhodobacterales bacterium HKCCA1065]
MNPEKVAYWYLRLNGFLQIEDFYVHPGGRGSARTDADLLAVRFPHRAERLYDDPTDIMQDDADRLALSVDRIDVVIAEVKAGRCGLNGPWTTQADRNIQRVLAAIGCLPPDRIERAAKDIYCTGTYEGEDLLRIRLAAIGREENEEVRSTYPNVRQVIWQDVLGFIFDRHQKYRKQKTQTDHWDATGMQLKHVVTTSGMTQEGFVKWAHTAMSVCEDPQ